MAFARQLPGSCRTSWLFFKRYLLASRLNKQQASGAFLSRDSFWLANRLEPVVIKGQSERKSRLHRTWLHAARSTKVKHSKSLLFVQNRPLFQSPD